MSTSSNDPGGQARTGGDNNADEIKREARDFADTARQEGKARVDDARDAAADNIDKLADGARAAASELGDGDSEQLSNYIAEAAERMGKLSGSLREKSVDELMGDLTRFARDEPAMFLSGSVAIGFGLARFARASGSRTDAGSSSAKTPSHADTGDGPDAGAQGSPASTPDQPKRSVTPSPGRRLGTVGQPPDSQAPFSPGRPSSDTHGGHS